MQISEFRLDLQNGQKGADEEVYLTHSVRQSFHVQFLLVRRIVVYQSMYLLSVIILFFFSWSYPLKLKKY